MGKTDALTWRNVCVNYGHTSVLKDASAVVPQGAVVGLVGSNGAGKSTLLRLAAGVLRPDSGEVHILGEVFDPRRVDSLKLIGYMDQRRPLYDNFTIRDIFTLGSRLNSTWDMAFAVQQMDRLNLPLGKRVGHLSGGQRTQVSIATAMAKRAPVVLLDEPLSDLDPASRLDLLAILAQEADRGTTLILSSHNLGDLEKVCTHYVLVHDRRVVLSDSSEAIQSRHVLISAPANDLAAIRERFVVLREEVREGEVVVIARDDAPDADRSRWNLATPTLEEILIASSSTQRLARSEV